MARLEKDIASPRNRATLEESFKLAEAMGLNGTPSYVIGNAGGDRRGRRRHPAGKNRRRTLRQGDVLSRAFRNLMLQGC